MVTRPPHHGRGSTEKVAKCRNNYAVTKTRGGANGRTTKKRWWKWAGMVWRAGEEQSPISPPREKKAEGRNKIK